MCGVCGCGDVGPNHAPSNGHSQLLAPSQGNKKSSTFINVEKSILSENTRYANINRRYFAQKSILSLNFLSSPGSGKTTLLVKTIQALAPTYTFYVIEGDQQTSMDADRIKATGAAALQINTGKGCHLDAHMIGHACDSLSIPEESVLCIENVGNLVCPADFDLGERLRVVVLSTTEGEDKPLKYPNIFYKANLILLNKSDLIPYLDFDAELCEANIRSVNPTAKIIYTSAKTGEGMDDWYSWLARERTQFLASES